MYACSSMNMYYILYEIMNMNLIIYHASIFLYCTQVCLRKRTKTNLWYCIYKNAIKNYFMCSLRFYHPLVAKWYSKLQNSLNYWLYRRKKYV